MALQARREDMGSSAADRAAAALERARDDPSGARAEALIALGLARAADDPATAATAERALGLAARAEHDLSAALSHLRRAVRIAERQQLRSVAAKARVSLFGTLALRGDFVAALREADRAARGLRGLDKAMLEVQRATVLMMQGERLDEALDGLQRALPVMRRAGETALEATVLENRGLVQCYRGALGAAEADLLEAEQLRVGLGQERLAATVRQNLGFVAARRGDLPAALAWFDRADEFFRTRGLVDSMGLRDRCEALLGARLVVEARGTAEQAVAALSSAGMASHLAEARLMLAQAALLDGDTNKALVAAEQAARAFARQHRVRHRELAEHLRLKAAWQSGDRSERLLRAARRSARRLDEYGWAGPSQEARLIAGRVAAELGRPVVARRELEAASRTRRRGPVELRIRACHADALLRVSAGDRPGAERALRAGMQMLDRHRALLGATDLRVHSAAHAAELADLGLRMAMREDDAERVLWWVERWRAGSLTSPPARPPEDERLQSQLAQLRQVISDIDRAALDGRTTRRLLARQADLERSVRDLARHATGHDLASDAGPVPVRDLADALGDNALIEFFAIDGWLHAATLAERQTRIARLAPMADVVREAEALRFALGRLAHQRGSPASRAAAEAAFDHGRRGLEELLLTSISGAVADRPLVIVPTGPLHAIPWSCLPSSRSRTVTVAPSARLWHEAARRGSAPPHGSRVVLASGPDVPGAAAEIGALQDCYPGAVCLTREEARVETVAAALDGAGLGHIVAHGRFRSDNPLFSSLKLSDGALTVYDLEALGTAPERLVLSACDSGLSDVGAGDELRGLLAALLTLGTRTVIAPVTAVSDAATSQVMADLHRGLAAGHAPAVALEQARLAAAESAEARAAASAFVCFGAG